MALNMSFMDTMKDKASKLIPTPFTDLVEEATSELLLVPDYDRIMFLCDSANAKEEHAVDLVRAVRRRIQNKSAKIQYFTVVLLDAMIKNCGLPVHGEIAETKGLLVDLVAIAARKPSADGEADAKKAALQLVLNMSIWFSSHRSDRVKPLTSLVDAVRAHGATFDGLEPDLTVSLRTDAGPPDGRGAAGGGGGGATPGGTRVRRQNRAQRHAEFAGHQRDAVAAANEPRVVTAIPLIIPTDEELSGMLDAAMLLVECLNAAEASGSPLYGDEVISNVGMQVRRDHRKLSQIISSGAELENLEMMLTVCDSQVAVIQRVADAIRSQNAEEQMPSDLHNVPAGGASSAYPPPPGYDGVAASASPVQQQQQQQQEQPQSPPSAITQGQPVRDGGSPGIRSALDVDEAPPAIPIAATRPYSTSPSEGSAASRKPATTNAAPSIDELFMDLGSARPSAASVTAAPAPPAPAPKRSPFPAPSQSLDPQTEGTEEMSRSDEAAHAATIGSLNNDTGDDFDAFLNNRLSNNQ